MGDGGQDGVKKGESTWEETLRQAASEGRRTCATARTAFGASGALAGANAASTFTPRHTAGVQRVAVGLQGMGAPASEALAVAVRWQSGIWAPQPPAAVGAMRGRKFKGGPQ